MSEEFSKNPHFVSFKLSEYELCNVPLQVLSAQIRGHAHWVDQVLKLTQKDHQSPERLYEVMWKGNTVVAIRPGGKYISLYNWRKI